MRVATWNLERPKRKGYEKNQARLEKLVEINADIWILTETNEAINLPGYEAAPSIPVDNYHGSGENFSTIHSRWPIIRYIPTWDPYFSVCVEINSPFGPLLVYGTIITYANDRGPNNDSPRWQEHRKSINHHCLDWAKLRKEYPNHLFILGGDFNQSRDGSGWYEDSMSVSSLNEALVTSSLKCVTQEKLQETRGLSRATVDHLCLPTSLPDECCRVDAWEGVVNGRKLSDHNGILVDIDI